MSYDNQYYAPPPPAAPNNSTAIISLIAGILGLTLLPTLGSIVAVITGSMAKKEIQQSGGMQGGMGMAQAGLIMGWIGIILFLLALCGVGAFILLTGGLAFLSLGEYNSILPLIPFLLEGAAGTARYMQDDGLHPTAEGNRLVAANVVRTLVPLLSAPSK